MKATIKHRLAMKIEGFDYSQTEFESTWEVEGEDANELKKKLEGFVVAWVEELSSKTELKYRNKIQDLESKLEKAREEYIKLSKENNER
jgi:hypothetical protein